MRYWIALAGGLSMAFGWQYAFGASRRHIHRSWAKMGYIAAVAAGSATAALLMVLLKKAGHAHNDAQ